VRQDSARCPEVDPAHHTLSYSASYTLIQSIIHSHSVHHTLSYSASYTLIQCTIHSHTAHHTLLYSASHTLIQCTIYSYTAHHTVTPDENTIIAREAQVSARPRFEEPKGGCSTDQGRATSGTEAEARSGPRRADDQGRVTPLIHTAFETGQGFPDGACLSPYREGLAWIHTHAGTCSRTCYCTYTRTCTFRKTPSARAPGRAAHARFTRDSDPHRQAYTHRERESGGGGGEGGPGHHRHVR
jgi:hypothetical protein